MLSLTLDSMRISKARCFLRVFSSSFSSDTVAPKRIVFLGTPEIAALALNILHKNMSSNTDGVVGYEIVGAVSQPPALMGNKKKPTPSPVQLLSQTLNIPVLTPESAKDPVFIEQLKALDIDLCITAAYGNYLPKKFLSIPKYGTINIHPSLLPKYRGAAPVQRCLENGDSETGVSVLYTVSAMDAGPILKQITVLLDGHEKAPDILTKTFQLGAEMVVELLPSIFDGTAVSTAQDDAHATNAPKLSVSESVVDFQTMSATAIHNKVRGFAEWPGTFAYFHVGGETSEARKIKIITTEVISAAPESCSDSSISTTSSSNSSSGHSSKTSSNSRVLQLIKRNKKHMFALTCGDGSVLGLVEIQPPTKKVMSVQAFVNGLSSLSDATVRWVDAPAGAPSPASPLQTVVNAEST